MSYFSGRAGGDWMQLHFWSGYAILTLMLFRIVWGFVGSTHGALLQFPEGSGGGASPISAHLLGRGRPARRRAQSDGRRDGRRPDLRRAGRRSWPGCFTADTDTGMVNGPLALKVADKWVDRATAFHDCWINVLLIAGGDPRAAVVVYLVWKRQNLIGADDHRPQAARRGGGAGRARTAARSSRSGRLAMSSLLACAAIVYFIVSAGG